MNGSICCGNLFKLYPTVRRPIRFTIFCPYPIIMTQTVLIVGCGVFGLSTALELARKGYDVTAIDLYPIPSKWAASNDLNKIIRTEYADMFYTRLSVEALGLWENDPLYKDVYFKSGRVTLSPSSKENQHRAKFENQGFDNLAKLGADVSGIFEISDGKKLGELFPQFKENAFSEITAKFNPNAGYGHASNSLLKVYEEAKRLGVKFIFGSKGNARKVVNNSSIQVESGEIYSADKILIAAGAATGFIVDLQDQIRALGLFVTHIKLSPEEYNTYKDIPIFFSAEYGYFFPPDAKHRHMKIALTYSDAENMITDPFNKNKTISLPRFKEQHKQDTFPKNGEIHVRRLLQKTIPKLSQHELFNSKLCWISDTPTSDFLIDKLPDSKNIVVACGDAGHGYKFLPNIGKYIVLKLEDNLDEVTSKRWCWKNEPVWPVQFVSRAKREHVDVKNVDWRIDPSDPKL